MDFFTIIIQFITVLFASILGPIGLNWFKNKNKIEVQRKKIALKLYQQLQDYCFILAKSINNHYNALTTLYRDAEGQYECSIGKLQWYHSIPSIEIDDQIYILDDDIVCSFFLFVRKSQYTEFDLQSLESIDIELIIDSYCETTYTLVKNAMVIFDLLGKKYGIPFSNENWLDLIPNRLKEENKDLKLC